MASCGCDIRKDRQQTNSPKILLLPLLQPRSDDFGSGGHGGNPDLVALVS